MSTQVQNINKISSGLCPHGLPQGACPICSKMGGGSFRAGEKMQKAGEMSYHECAMIGNMIKARKLAQKAQLHNKELQAIAIKNFELTMLKIVNNLHNFIIKTPINFITRPIVFFIKIGILPVINFIKNIPKFVQHIQNLKIEIQDKLNAIFGEARAFLEKRISNLKSNIKSRFIGLFRIIKKDKTNNDDTKIDEEKRMINLKKIINKIVGKKKEKYDDSKDK